MSYASMLHWDWVERNCKVKCSPIGRKAAYILGIAGRGIYNAPINVSKVDWANPLHTIVNWEGSVATFDGPALTALVMLAHHLGVRISIGPKNFRHMEIQFHPRNRRAGDICERHPDIETAVQAFRDVWPQGQDFESVFGELATKVGG